jgi:pentatricopeptide repeat protein
MISGYQLNGCFYEAMELFEVLLKEGIVLSNVRLLSPLSLFMVKNGFEWHGVLGTSLIDMYSKCGSIESALAVFKATCNKKLGHWTAIIVGL